MPKLHSASPTEWNTRLNGSSSCYQPQEKFPGSYSPTFRFRWNIAPFAASATKRDDAGGPTVANRHLIEEINRQSGPFSDGKIRCLVLQCGDLVDGTHARARTTPTPEVPFCWIEVLREQHPLIWETAVARFRSTEPTVVAFVARRTKQTRPGPWHGTPDSYSRA